MILNTFLIIFNFSIPKSLSDALLAAAGEQNKSSEKFQALCSAVLKQVVPDANINIPDVGPPVPENQVPYLIPVILCQVHVDQVFHLLHI